MNALYLTLCALLTFGESLSTPNNAIEQLNYFLTDKNIIPEYPAVSLINNLVTVSSLNLPAVYNEKLQKLEDRMMEYPKAFLQVARRLITNSAINLEASVQIVRLVAIKRRALLFARQAANTTEASRLASDFKASYSTELALLSDALYASMTDPYMVRHDMVNKVSILTHRSPVETSQFVNCVIQLWLQILMLDFNYLELNQVPDKALDVFKTKNSDRIIDILKHSEAIYFRMVRLMSDQLTIDIQRFQANNEDLSHCEIAEMMRKYFLNKYRDYDFLVLAYDGSLEERKYQARSICRGAITPIGKDSDRTILVAARRWNESSDGGAGFREKAETALDQVGIEIRQSDYALSLVDRILGYAHQGRCGQLQLVTAIKLEVKRCIAGDLYHYVEDVKAVERCNTKLCWIKRRRNFAVTLFG